jgi:hypothetical protein
MDGNGDEEYTSIVPVVIFSSAIAGSVDKIIVARNRDFSFLRITSLWLIYSNLRKILANKIVIVNSKKAIE